MSVFQTKAWQRSWWETWGDNPGFELVKDSGNGENGVYLAKYRFKGLPIRSLECVGVSHRCVSTPRTEYNTVTGHVEKPDEYDRLLKLLTSLRWTEAVFCDFRVNSREYASLKRLARDKRWLWRLLEEDTAYSVDTTGTFQDYLASLGSNTRLRLYNRRKILESLGEVKLKEVTTDEEGEFFGHLARFYQHRWGSPCFGGDKGMEFQRKFLQRLPAEGGRPRLTELWLDKRLISVLYNVEYQGRVYNLQGGFDDQVHKKVSPGTLHLGYAIEQCFESNDVEAFDMLVGTGKNENYKVRIATDGEPLASVMIVRSWLFRLIYHFKR